MVPKASQEQGAVESMGDSTRFIEMDQNFDVTRRFRQGVEDAASSPATHTTRRVGHQAFGSTDAAGIPRETPAHGIGFPRADQQQQDSIGDAPHAPGLSARMTSEDLPDTGPHAPTMKNAPRTTTSPFGAQRESLTSRS